MIKTEAKSTPRSFVVSMLILLILICSANYYCNFVAPSSPHKKLYKVVAEAKLITPEQLSTYCNTNKIVQMELYTPESGVKTKFGKTYAFEDLSAWLYHKTYLGFHSRWVHREIFYSEPKVIELCTASLVPVLKVKTFEIDHEYTPILFDAVLKRFQEADLPASWKFSPDPSLLPDPATRKLRSYGLPVSTRVTVVGTVWKTKEDGVYLKGFSYPGMMGLTEEAAPIVTPISRASLLKQMF